MMPLNVIEAALSQHGCNPQRRGDHVDARCPGHDDANPSLSVDIGTDGRALVHCHAGCSLGEIVAALGLEPAALFPENGVGRREREIVATYSYTDADGVVLYDVVRYSPKDFRQRRPDGAGGWTWSLRGVDRVPYRLPELLEAVAAGRWILVVEGEKDVENLRRLGFVATCNAGGAGKWQPRWAEHFRGAKVAVLPDNDAPGRDHAQLVGRSLIDVAADLRVLELPGLAEHGDVSDWLAAGGTAEELKRLIREAPSWTPDAAPTPAEPLGPVDQSATSSEVPWPEPVPLPAARDCVGFPPEILGEKVAAFCDAVAAETGTPTDLAAIAALGTVSAVIAGAVVVEAHRGWRESTNLYLNLLAAPGEGKTPAMRKVVRPLDLVERERREWIGPSRLEAERRRRVAETRLKQLEAIAAKAGPAERDEAMEDVLEAARELDKIVVPAQPRVYTREATPEALVRLLADQNGRSAVVTDEGSEFYELAARYSGNGKGNVGIYVDGFDGKRHLSDRVGRDPIVIERTTLTVVLFGQPVVLGDLAANAQMSGRGVLARFCWSLPTTKVGHRPVHRQPVDERLTAEWAELVLSLARQAAGNEEPAALFLEAGAKQLWDAWRERHEPRLRPDVGDLAPIVEWAAKLPGQVLRFAGVLHAMRTGRLEGTVSAETMRAALALADYFTDHARVVFARMGSDKGLDDARSVLRWIEGRELAEFTTRDVNQSKDWDVERVRGALETLAEYGWVRRLPREVKAGRPSERWERNPESADQNPSEPPPEQVLSRSDPHFPGSSIQPGTPSEDPLSDDPTPDEIISEELHRTLGLRVAALPDHSAALAELGELGFLELTTVTWRQYGEILAILDGRVHA